ncbi:Odorant receptor 404, partial [Nylanderia fulva]
LEMVCENVGDHVVAIDNLKKNFSYCPSFILMTVNPVAQQSCKERIRDPRKSFIQQLSHDSNQRKASKNVVKDEKNRIKIQKLAPSRSLNIVFFAVLCVSNDKNKIKLSFYFHETRTRILLLISILHSSPVSQSPVINLRPTFVTNRSDAVGKSAYCSNRIGSASLQIATTRSKVQSFRIIVATFHSIFVFSTFYMMVLTTIRSISTGANSTSQRIR